MPTIQQMQAEYQRAAKRATGGRTGMQYPKPKPKPKGDVYRPGTKPPPNGGFTIESPAQIEERVRRMADEAYKRQKTLYDEDAAAMRLQAEGRQKGLQAAYEAAAKANAGMGADVQAGWTQAGQNIAGLAQTSTGGVRDTLLADLASTEEALARVGAGGTGFDALSQAGVEQYRGGIVPGEFDLRMGGVGRQFANEAGIALNNYGLQTGQAQFGKENADISAERDKRLRDLTAGRTEYENDLRSQLQKAQGDQQDFILAQQETKAKIAYQNLQLDQAQQKINLEYAKAKASVSNKADKLALDKWYKENTLSISRTRAAIAQQQANISQGRLDIDTTAASLPNGGKPPGPGTVSSTINRALGPKGAGVAALNATMKKLASGIPGLTPPPKWDKELKGNYTDSTEYAAAYSAYKLKASQNFNLLMHRVTAAITPHLKGVGWNKARIARAAYEIAVQKADPLPTYKIPKGV